MMQFWIRLAIADPIRVRDMSSCQDLRLRSSSGVSEQLRRSALVRRQPVLPAYFLNSRENPELFGPH